MGCRLKIDTLVRNESARGGYRRNEASSLRVRGLPSRTRLVNRQPKIKGRRGKKNRGAYEGNNKNGGSSRAAEVPKSHMTPCFSSICQTHVSLFFPPVSRTRRDASLFLSPPRDVAPSHPSSPFRSVSPLPVLVMRQKPRGIFVD